MKPTSTLRDNLFGSLVLKTIGLKKMCPQFKKEISFRNICKNKSLSTSILLDFSIDGGYLISYKRNQRGEFKLQFWKVMSAESVVMEKEDEVLKNISPADWNSTYDEDSIKINLFQSPDSACIFVIGWKQESQECSRKYFVSIVPAPATTCHFKSLHFHFYAHPPHRKITEQVFQQTSEQSYQMTLNTSDGIKFVGFNISLHDDNRDIDDETHSLQRNESDVWIKSKKWISNVCHSEGPSQKTKTLYNVNISSQIVFDAETFLYSCKELNVRKVLNFDLELMPFGDSEIQDTSFVLIVFRALENIKHGRSPDKTKFSYLPIERCDELNAKGKPEILKPDSFFPFKATDRNVSQPSSNRVFSPSHQLTNLLKAFDCHSFTECSPKLAISSSSETNQLSVSTQDDDTLESVCMSPKVETRCILVQATFLCRTTQLRNFDSFSKFLLFSKNAHQDTAFLARSFSKLILSKCGFPFSQAHTFSRASNSAYLRGESQEKVSSFWCPFVVRF
jgi:hypothetical protein